MAAIQALVTAAADSNAPTLHHLSALSGASTSVPATPEVKSKTAALRPVSSPAGPGAAASPGAASAGDGTSPASQAGGAVAVVPNVESPAAQRAYAMTAEANKGIEGGLHRCREWGHVRELYFHAGALFQEAGMHFEAAESFNNSAAICRVFGSPLEVANAVSYAVDSYKRVDNMQAVALLKELVEIHAVGERPKLEAKAAREIATIYEALGADEDALHWYTHAHNLYATLSDTARNFFLQTLNKVARLTAKLQRFREAIPVYEKLAVTVTTGTRATHHYFHAMLCWLADARGEKQAGGLAKAKTEFEKYQDQDKFFQTGVEHKLIRGLITASEKMSLADFDEVEATYREYRKAECDAWFDTIVALIRDNLFQHLLPFM